MTIPALILFTEKNIMKRTISKKIIIALLSAFVAVCMGFALLLSRPAAQANAEENELPRLSLDYLFEENERYGTATLSETETYSEIWVINEKWDYSKAFSAEINGRVSDGSEYEQYRKFSKFEISTVDTSPTLKVGAWTISWYSASVCYYQNIPQVQEMTYDEWKYTFGKVTFYADTSAVEYSELRTWLEANAVNVDDKKIDVWYNGDIVQAVSVPFGTTYEQLDKTKAPAKEGYTCIGWSNTQNASAADTGLLNYANSSGVFYIQVYPVYEANAVETAKVYRLNDGAEIGSIPVTGTIKDADFSFVPTTYNGASLLGYYTAYISWTNETQGNVPNPVSLFKDTGIYVLYDSPCTIKVKDGETEKGEITIAPAALYEDVLFALKEKDEFKKSDYEITGFTYGSSMYGVEWCFGAKSLYLTLKYTRQKSCEIIVKEDGTQKGTLTAQVGENLKALDLSPLNLEQKAGKRPYICTQGSSRRNYIVEQNMTVNLKWEDVPTYTITFMNGEDVLGTVEATEGDKLSALDMSSINAVKEGYTFKGWSYSENGELIDLEEETVTEAKTLYAVYEKNAEPTEPEQPDNPAQPDKPSDSSNANEVKKVIGITFGLLLIALAVAIAFRVKHYRKK